MERRKRIGWLLLFIGFAYLLSEALVASLVPGPVDAAMGSRLRVLCLEPPRRLELTAQSIRMQPDVGVQSADSIVLRWEDGTHVLETPGKEDQEVDGPIHLTWQGVATWKDGKGGTRRDIGSMTLTQIDGKRRVWLSIGIEAYLSGVLAREMGARFPLEALKAQAVAARSFAMNAAARRRTQGYPWDLRGGQSDMVYRGIDSSTKIRKAVEETRGQVLAFDEMVLRAYFSATCGGRTRDGEERFKDVPAEPFRSVECKGCEGVTRHRWTQSVERTVIDRTIAGLGSGELEWKVRTRSERGDWIVFEVRSPAGSWQEMDMTRARGRLGLYSTWITAVESAGDKVRFDGHGWGHGVGLCQNGAKGYAKAGWNYREILKHYFNGTPLRKIGD